jgi:hypothetical protein
MRMKIKKFNYFIESKTTSIIEELLDTISAILADLMDYDKVELMPISRIESNLNDPDLDYQTSIARIDFSDENIETITNITHVITHYITKYYKINLVLGVTKTSGKNDLLSGNSFDDIIKDFDGVINIMTIMIKATY